MHPPKTLSSLQNPTLKHCVKLREDSRYRKLHSSVFISGYKLVREIAKIAFPKKLFIEKIEDCLPAEEVFLATSSVLKKLIGLPSYEPIAAEFSLPNPSNLEEGGPLLVLDSIRDPGNLGTLLRTALGIGWQGVFLLPTCVDPFHDKVIRASRGALFQLPWKQGEWQELLLLQKKQDLKLYVADIEGTPVTKATLDKKALLLLSNEAKGVSGECKKLGEKITIPMPGGTESLNVAVAGSILMFMWMK